MGGAALAVSTQLPGAATRAAVAVEAAALLAAGNAARAAWVVDHLPIDLPAQPVPWHALDVDEVLERTRSSHDGLRGEEAAERLPVPEAPTPPWLLLTRAIVEETWNPLTPVLATGAALSWLVGSPADAATVGLVVGLGSTVGGTQRFQAERAVRTLAATEVNLVRARRDGVEQPVASDQLVTGDVIVLGPGERVPADARLVETESVEVDESSLTGETALVSKGTDPVWATELSDCSSMLYADSVIAVGRAVAVVVATGADTEVGRAAAIAARAPVRPAGLQGNLERLTRVTIPVAGAAGAGVGLLGLLRGRPLNEVLSTGVSLAVAAVPEGLPLLATAAELASARRLSAGHVVVHQPATVEALGRTDVLLADKTGTLTEGSLSLVGVYDGSALVDGALLARPDPDDPEPVAHERWHRVLRVAAWASPRADGTEQLHPTDGAVVDAARDQGLAAAPAVGAVLPFDPDRGYHATWVPDGETSSSGLVAVKGSPEQVLPRCRWFEDADGTRHRFAGAPLQAFESMVEQLAGEGHRVLAVATRNGHDGGSTLRDDDVDGLTAVGLIALGDPVRPTAADALATLEAAGITVVMATGDHPMTARHVARAVGLVGPDEDPRLCSLTGVDIDRLDDDALALTLERVKVVARATPTHKARIVRALQDAGATVVMVGDGANDTAPIRLADVGVALGSTATSGARATADLLVLDDGLDRLVDAVAEGRAMWASVQDAVGLLLGHNLGEIAFTTIGSAIDGMPPLSGRQLLLVNLLTDVVPTMAIVLRPPSDAARADLLAGGPWTGFDQRLRDDVVTRAVTTTAGATMGWSVARVTGTRERARTVGLVSLVGTQLGQTVLVGGNNLSTWLATGGTAAFMVAVVQTPGVSQLFGCRPLGPVGWATAIWSATAATAAQVLAPQLLDRFGDHLPSWPDHLLDSAARRVADVRTPDPWQRSQRSETSDFTCDSPPPTMD